MSEPANPGTYKYALDALDELQGSLNSVWQKRHQRLKRRIQRVLGRMGNLLLDLHSAMCGLDIGQTPFQMLQRIEGLLHPDEGETEEGEREPVNLDRPWSECLRTWQGEDGETGAGRT